ncbi:type VI secretion lipoprotein, VC_A0113 family [Burkholderia sp. Ch1-1]|uniref:Type VI secretion lipoprotein, VC_A0113 family n=1 Tax=Paraburkholderia dioscoreae TaxID=2604047 RepID=A0A5Q4YT88_9BURK|nr:MULTISPECIES: type VI secretion system lipoprotein TssJ [Paraburkholderia]EIF31100.1 type VI secretion lipoprotein, VC_A0113 family [Burkholderia sp. Ch1-1]MDR8401093.1 type VI secretion system lipoprotein TssJ [Paraburkholderia sp. USG1]VVD28709.1 Type VI secretion lipoprotein, VC_A0113 family [Paraburkholderia dioscoreae]
MRLFTHVIALALASALTACASSDPKTAKEPIKLELSVVASTGVNPDDQKRAAPIVVRVYELRTDGAFNSADFFSLQDKDKTALAEDLVTRAQFQLRPGESKSIRTRADPATTVVGILAAYRDLPNSVWRAAYPLPPAPDAAWYRRAPKLKLIINLEANAIRITETK